MKQDGLNDKKKFEDILKQLKGMFDELKDLPKLRFPELTNELNDLLWIYDGIEESYERMQAEFDDDSLAYYLKGIKDRHNDIAKNYLHLLN